MRFCNRCIGFYTVVQGVMGCIGLYRLVSGFLDFRRDVYRELQGLRS